MIAEKSCLVSRLYDLHGEHGESDVWDAASLIEEMSAALHEAIQFIDFHTSPVAFQRCAEAIAKAEKMS